MNINVKIDEDTKLVMELLEIIKVKDNEIASWKKLAEQQAQKDYASWKRIKIVTKFEELDLIEYVPKLNPIQLKEYNKILTQHYSDIENDSDYDCSLEFCISLNKELYYILYPNSLKTISYKLDKILTMLEGVK